MTDDTLVMIATELRDAAWEVALASVELGLEENAIPSLARLGRLGQLGDVPTFVAQVARELADPQPSRLRHGSPLVAVARDHARRREALGFTPREIVTEFLLLRRALWSFVSERAAALGAEELLVAEQRLNEAIDGLVAECVLAYFDRALSDLSLQARQDPLTGLLNYQALTEELELELARARRYGHGLALVCLDVDEFKRVNDTLGHQEGDRVLRRMAQLLRETLRSSDLAGRMGGDEFAVVLVESDEEAAGRFVERLLDRLDEGAALAPGLPQGFTISPGVAHFPSDGRTLDDLFRVADRRLYEVKRSR